MRKSCSKYLMNETKNDIIIVYGLKFQTTVQGSSMTEYRMTQRIPADFIPLFFFQFYRLYNSSYATLTIASTKFKEPIQHSLPVTRGCHLQSIYWLGKFAGSLISLNNFSISVHYGKAEKMTTFLP